MSNRNFLKFSFIFISIFGIICYLGYFPGLTNNDFLSANSDSNIEKTVIIDAGHGGEDGGACNYGGLFEKDINLMIARNLRDMLKSCGVNVIMTRDGDYLLYDKNSDYKGKKKSMDLYERLKIANSHENAIFISIHMNAFPVEKYRGLQVYHSEKGIDLARNIQNDSKDWIMPENNRKPKPANRNIYLMDRFNGVGVLVECGFLSNDEERALLNTEDYRQKISMSLFLSIMSFIDN